MIRLTETSTNRSQSPLARVAQGASLLAVIGVATFFRVWRIDAIHFWFDETFSLRMAEFPIPEMVVRCTRDTHPPLFFICMKVWSTLFGTGEVTARLHSVLWSLGAVGCGFGFLLEALKAEGQYFMQPSRALYAAIVAGLCLALSPLQITWAQQVRMYAPVACLSILSTWMLWRAVDQPTRITRWVTFVVIEAMGVYTHVTMLFVVASHVLAMAIVIFQFRKSGSPIRPLARPALSAFGAVALLTLPWLIVVHGQHERVQDDFWSQPLTAQIVGEAFVKCFTVSKRPVADYQNGFWIAQGAIVLLLWTAAGRRPANILVSLTAGIPILFVVAVSYFDRNIIHQRYFIAGHSAICLAIGMCLTTLPSWILRGVAGTAVCATIGFFTLEYQQWREEQAGKTGIPEMLETWMEHSESEEPLIFCNPMSHTTALRYASDDSPLSIYGRMEDYPFFVGTAITSPEDYTSREQIRNSAWRTIWICDFGNRTRYLNPVDLGSEWLLVADTSFRDYSGTFILRRYDRNKPTATDSP